MCEARAIAPPEPLQVLALMNSTYTRQPLVTIVLPELPPTVNHMYGRRGNRTFLKPEAVAWFERNAYFVNQAYRKRSPIMGSVAVLTVFHIKRWRKWDLDNREKAKLDLLTKCGVWGDDSQAEMKTDKRVINGSLEHPETHIYIWELEPAETVPSKPRKKRATSVRPRRGALV